MRRMLDRLHEADSPAAVVLGFRPADPLAYGRVIAGPDGIIEKMVEFKDATDAERAVDLCNSGLMAVRSTDLFGLLARVGNSNAAGEYYLPDIVMLAAADGRRSAVVATGAGEVAGGHRRPGLATGRPGEGRVGRGAPEHDGVTRVDAETGG